MKGLLAATVVVVMGCTFTPPEPAGSGNDPDPDPSMDPGADAGIPEPDAPMDGPPAVRCAAYDYDYGGHKYRLTMNGQNVRQVTWMAGKTDCESDGGYLMKINSGNEDQRVEDVLGFGGPSEVWIGLHDANQQGTYLWTDGTAPTFTHWSSAPSAASPDCVAKNTNPFDGRWFTRDCANTRPAICECEP